MRTQPRSFGELAEEFTASQGQASWQDSRASVCGGRRASQGDIDGESRWDRVQVCAWDGGRASEQDGRQMREQDGGVSEWCSR